MSLKTKGFLYGIIAAVTYGMNPCLHCLFTKKALIQIPYCFTGICLPLSCWPD